MLMDHFTKKILQELGISKIDIYIVISFLLGKLRSKSHYQNVYV